MRCAPQTAFASLSRQLSLRRYSLQRRCVLRQSCLDRNSAGSRHAPGGSPGTRLPGSSAATSCRACFTAQHRQSQCPFPGPTPRAPAAALAGARGCELRKGCLPPGTRREPSRWRAARFSRMQGTISTSPTLKLRMNRGGSQHRNVYCMASQCWPMIVSGDKPSRSICMLRSS